MSQGFLFRTHLELPKDVALWAEPFLKADGGTRPNCTFVLQRDLDNRLNLFREDNPRENFRLDLLSSANRQLIKTFGKNQLLPKALGVPRGTAEVWDLTAGLGEDSWALASLGLRVRAFERHPLVAWMLAEALEVATRSEHASIAKRIELVPRAFDSSQDFPSAGVAALFDPMFEDQERKTKPRKEMLFLADLVGPDLDQGEFARAARQSFGRLAIKRSTRQPSLASDVNLVFEGKGFRYDVYLIAHSHIGHS